MGNTDLIDAYNAGLNGTDLSRETRDNAAAGGYLDSIEAMYNAGRQDAKTQSTGDGTEDDLSAEAAEKEKILQNDIDNLENMGYTKSNSAESTDTVDELIQYTDTANNYEASNTSSGASDSTASGKTYKITDDEKELNYMMDMLFMNGAGSSTDPSIQMAYEWVSNPDNKGKAIPDEIKDAFYKFMSSVTEDQIVRSNRIAVGKDDELGLAGKIYEAKAANRKSTDNASQYYPEANTSAPVSTSLGDYAASTGKNNQESYSWGEAGRFALGETLKSNPNIFGERSSFLYEAYQAGLNGVDLTKELVADAKAGGFLDEIEAMQKAGETDAKIAKGDVEIDSAENLYYKNEDDNQEESNFQYPTADISAVTQGFGVWSSYEEGYHMGIDIGEVDGENSNIGAIYDGEVVFSGWAGKNGYMVIIQHTENINGMEITFYSSYSHLKKKGIEKGMEVNPGDSIGIMGNTGKSRGPHLHFAIFTTTMSIDSLSPYGYGKYQINDYAWKSSSSGHTIYYDPNEVFETNGEIILDTLNALEENNN